MKVLILNLENEILTQEHPKCMMKISNRETILSRQLNMICEAGFSEVIIMFNLFDDVLVRYCNSLNLPIDITFVQISSYKNMNDVYSIDFEREYLDDDILVTHSDLIFENMVFDAILESNNSCIIVSSTEQVLDNGLKAVIRNGFIKKVGIESLNEAMVAYPLYKLLKKDSQVWFDNIVDCCKKDGIKYCTEKILNKIFSKCQVYPIDIKNQFCGKINNLDNLAIALDKLKAIETCTIYMCFSTDVLHNGHISIIKRAKRLGKLIIGVLSDEAIVSNGRFPLISFNERKNVFENIIGVHKVVEQKTISYKENLEKYRPKYVIHSDNWIYDFQKPIRDEVVSVLADYGGQLIEYSYLCDERNKKLEQCVSATLSMPDIRRSRLKKIIAIKGIINAIEAHSGLTGLIAENSLVYENGRVRQFDAMWVSSLCNSILKGKPDIEIVDMTSRFRTIDDIMDVTTKPIIFDGGTGGLTEHFVYTVRTLERMGVSMVVIEDKTGLKKNSLFGTEVQQTQASISDFCEKIAAGKKAQRTNDFMICARIESLILEQGMEDALKRAFAFVDVGADAIMIHSRKKDPGEIFEFVEKFRFKNNVTPIVVVPTSFNKVTEEEFEACGVNIIIYANQLTRAGIPAMQNAAKMILKNHRAKECDDICMPFRDIITLMQEEI